MLKLRKIKPIFSQVLVTEDLYGWDDKNAAGIIVHKKGDLKTHQKVLAIGDDVKTVKPGDLVEVNLYKYAVFKEDPNSVKAMADNPMVGLRLNEVELTDENDESVYAFIIDQRDIKYIITDSEEVAYNDKDELQKVENPKATIIVPNKKLIL